MRLDEIIQQHPQALSPAHQAEVFDFVLFFVVYCPKVGGPIQKEGGLSACAEAGFNADKQKFYSFINELLFVKLAFSLRSRSVKTHTLSLLGTT